MLVILWAHNLPWVVFMASLLRITHAATALWQLSKMTSVTHVVVGVRCQLSGLEDLSWEGSYLPQGSFHPSVIKIRLLSMVMQGSENRCCKACLVQDSDLLWLDFYFIRQGRSQAHPRFKSWKWTPLLDSKIIAKDTHARWGKTMCDHFCHLLYLPCQVITGIILRG